MPASAATGARLRLLPLRELGVKVAVSTAWEILKKAGIDPAGVLAPGDAGGALGKGGLPAFPVDGEHGGGVPVGAGLAGGGRQQRAEQGDTPCPSGEQQVRGGVAEVGGVLAGQQPGARTRPWNAAEADRSQLRRPLS
jgi:hypothetical protein